LQEIEGVDLEIYLKKSGRSEDVWKAAVVAGKLVGS
jgi:hypothetical protein